MEVKHPPSPFIFFYFHARISKSQRQTGNTSPFERSDVQKSIDTVSARFRSLDVLPVIGLFLIMN